MREYIPFLKSKNSELEISENMELASAFLFFELSKGEAAKNLFAKQVKENIGWIGRGLYPLKAKLFSNENKLYCVYDAMGITKNIEISSRTEFGITLDAEKINVMEIKNRIKEIKKLSSSIKHKAKVEINTGSLLCGYTNIEKILGGKDDSVLENISANLEAYSKYDDNNISFIKEVISKILQSIEDGIELIKQLCIIDDVSFKNSITERNRLYEEFKDKIYGIDKEISGNIARLIMEREDRIREVEKIYTDKNTYITQDYIFNKNKYDIAKIYGNEIEMGIYQRSSLEAEDKLKQLGKESVEELKKVEKYYDNLLEEEKKKLKQTISDREKRIEECKDSYSSLHGAVDELKKFVSEDVCGRRNQVETIKKWFGRFEYNVIEDTFDIYIPFYMAEYTGNNARYKLFYPQELAEKGQIASMISGITGKIPLPFNERDELFKVLFEGLKGFINDDCNKSIINVLSAKNLLQEERMVEKVEDGLKILLSAGYLSDKNYDKVSGSIKSMFSGTTAI